MQSCNKKWDLLGLPKLQVINLTSNNQLFCEVSCGIEFGEKQDETEFGFCFSQDPNPTILDSIIKVVPDGKLLNIKYEWNNFNSIYVRAFSKNKLGISYSENELKLIWPANEDNIPQISLSSIDSVSYFFTDAQAVITNDGNLPIVQRGFIFSSNPNPAMSNSIVCYSPSLDLIFTNRNEGLSENTQYYVRAFVKNTYQTALSPEVLSFQTKNFYNVGELGPGGGKIFYSNLSGSTNWHFLEAAPTDFPVTLNWANNNNFITGLNTAIGSGYENTSLITLNQGNSGNYSALKASQFTFAGLNDWFLPSRDELIQLIQTSNIDPSFNMDLGLEYWSSSQDINFTQNAWVVKCTSSLNSYTLNKLSAKKARFIRRF